MGTQAHDTGRGKLKPATREERHDAAVEVLRTPGLPFRKLAPLIKDRDYGCCQVCGENLAERSYECGHLVDRVAGGADVPDNLVAMCAFCNRMKPVHDTLDAAWEWVNSGGVITSLFSALADQPDLLAALSAENFDARQFIRDVRAHGYSDIRPDEVRMSRG